MTKMRDSINNINTI